MKNGFSIIKSISIRKLWSNKDIRLDVYSDINFLIGINGSGKTTVVNLVAATLNVDLYTLMHIEFQSISIEVENPARGLTAVVSAENLLYHDNGEPKINFSIEVPLEPSISHSWGFDYIEDRSRIAEYRGRRRSYHIPRFTPSSIQDTMRRLVHLRWLPVNRSGRDYGAYEERLYRHSVDERIENQSRELAEMFSSLDTKEKENLADFQRKIFRSLIQGTPNTSDLLSLLGSIDLQNESKALYDILKQFNLDSPLNNQTLSTHFENLEKVQMKIDNKDFNLDIDEFSTVLRLRATHSVVDEWKKYCEKKEALYLAKNKFVNIFNEMAAKKEMIVNNRNRLEFKTKSGKVLQTEHLSSGEKQLLILLSETLLQRENNWIYIADEPELSLHVDWQQRLVSNIRKLNSSVQIIFATHSPDIVGRYQDKVFKMRKVLR